MGKTIVKEVTPYLRQGEENAIPARELAKICGVSPRVLRKTVERERLQGKLILASDLGYFTPDSGAKGLEEMRRFVRRSDARRKRNAMTTAAARAQIKALTESEITGQESLWQQKQH